MVLTKLQLQEALRRSTIPFPATATLAQLRALYDESQAGPSVLSATASSAAGSNTLLEADDPRPGQIVNEVSAAADDAGCLSAGVSSAASSVAGSDLVPSDDEQPAVVPPSIQATEAMLARLRKEKELLLLQREIAQMRGEVRPATVNRMNRIEFKDVENAVSEFTGDDEYSVRKWISDFEEVVDAYEVDDRFRYMAARRLLKGTAKIFLRNKNLPDWPSLRSALRRRFDRQLTGMEVREKMARRYKKADESYQRYVSEMEEIARQAEGISEAEIIEAIIYGLRDHSGQAAVLDTANSVEELVQMLGRYEKRRAMAGRASAAAHARGNSSSASDKRVKPSDGNSKDGKEKVRCFNCSKFGHVSADCKEPKRPAGACFSCHSTEHRYSQCPRRRVVGAVVDRENLPNADDDEAASPEALDAIQEVSVAFFRKQTSDWTNFNKCDSLFDTGSPVSFIERGKLPTEIRTDALTYSHFRGLGGSKLFTYGKTNCLVNFRGRIEQISFFVISDGILPNSMLLGRDCLEEFNIHLIQTTTKPFSAVDIVIAKTRQLAKQNNNKCPFDIHTRVCPINCSALNKINKFQPPISVLPPGIERSVRVGTVVDSDVSTEHDSAGQLGQDEIFFETLGNEKPWCGDINETASDPLALLSPPLHHILIDSDSSLQPLNAEWYKQSKFCDSPDTLVVCSVGVDGESNLFNTGPTLTESETGQLESVLVNAYIPPTEFKSRTSDMKMKIRLTSDVPFSYAPRSLSYAGKMASNKIVDELLQQGIIRPSDSPYASPIVLVAKKTGDIRMCVDYRTLNKITVRDNYPLPLIEDCLEYFQGNKYFTTLDLRNGFHQVEMDPDSIKYTSFVTPNGQYEYVRMPFGLKNAPSVFQRFIKKILSPFIQRGEIVIFMDDISLATKTFAEHIDLLRRVLQCLTDNGLELKLSKCKFCFDEIEYLGYKIGSDGIRPSDTHLLAIKNYPVPKNVKQLHSFIGLCSYFRRFVPAFSRIARPLHDLTRNGAVFNFDEQCMGAFETLRDGLASSPILALYNPKVETELHCDASARGFGAVLLQRQTNGKLHPIAYFSRSTTDQESRYHSFELETLAIIYALRRFRCYLDGIPFCIVTDCNSLTMTLNKKAINPRIARWALELENYDYSIQHRSGVRMGHVDALSRCHNSSASGQGEVGEVQIESSASDEPMAPEEQIDSTCVSDSLNRSVIALVNSEEMDFLIRAAQARDPALLALKQKLEETPSAPSALHELRDGLVCRRDRNRKLYFCVPQEMETELIRSVHEKIGHLGIGKCYDQMGMHYWFPEMKPKIERFVKNCVKCILYSAPARNNERNLYNIPKEPIPFHTLHIDHFGPLPSLVNKREHILLIVDAFTKYVKLYAMNSTSTREVCESLKKYFEYYGRPARIVSDRGTCFTSSEFREFLLGHNITHVKVAVASPQANGQVERMNRTLTGILSKLSEPMQHSDWVKQLQKVEFAFNNTVNRSIRNTPSALLFGVNQRGPEIDHLAEYLDEQELNPIQRDLPLIRKNASEAIQATQESNLRQFSEGHRPARTYQAGDFVVIRNVDTNVGSNKKLIQKYRGPYVVHKILPNDRYVIRDISGCQLTQMPYNGVLEARNMRLWRENENGDRTTENSSESNT